MQKVLVIIGPTASGKSALAVRLARELNGEVISADSRQVYKGLNIGTGKVTRREMRGVPHYLLDVANPKRKFSVSDYKRLADGALTQIISKNKLPIIVGGTGFYIDVLTGRASLPEVPPNKALRARLEKKNAQELFAILKRKDQERAESIDRNNKIRLVRALEIIEAIGRVPTSPLPSSRRKEREYIWIGLKPVQKDLEKRIYERLMSRLPGMIREARRLHARGLSWRRMEELGLEYRYLARLLQRKITKKEFIEELFKEIKKYSKRQMTWFKRNKEIRWLTPPVRASALATMRRRLARQR